MTAVLAGVAIFWLVYRALRPRPRDVLVVVVGQEEEVE